MTRQRLLEANEKGELEITGINPQARFYLVTGKDYLLLKEVEESSALDRFDKISAEIRLRFKESGVKRADIQKAVRWARKR